MAVWYGNPQQGVVERQIASGADDSLRAGAVYDNASAQIDAGDLAGASLWSGMRFTGITIPAGAVIDAVYIKFKAQFTRGAQTVPAYIYAEDVATPAQYGAAEDFSARTGTTATVSAAPNRYWYAELWFSSPTLKTIVDELIASYGPYTNGVMNFIWRNNGAAANNLQGAWSYDGAPAKAPVLRIEYHMPGWPYRKTHPGITGSVGGGAVTDYWVPMQVSRAAGADTATRVFVDASKCNANFSDVRFALPDGTLLQYNLDRVSGTDGFFFIKFPSLPASPTVTPFQVYFGNPGAVSASVPITPLSERFDTGEAAYTINDDGHKDCSATTWQGQTFTPINAITLRGLVLKMYRTNIAVPSVTVSIRATDGAGKPTGGDLASANFSGNTFTIVEGSAVFLTQLFAAPVALVAGTKYAICLRTTNAGLDFHWRSDSTAPTYGGGARVSSADSGVTWAEDLTVDMMFSLVTDKNTLDNVWTPGGGTLWGQQSGLGFNDVGVGDAYGEPTNAAGVRESTVPVPAGPGFAVRFRRLDEVNGDYDAVRITDGVNSIYAKVLSASAIIRYTDEGGVNHDAVKGFTVQTYDKIELQVGQDGVVKLLVNDVLQVTNATAMVNMTILAVQVSGAHRVRYDTIIVRPFVNPEPTPSAAWTSEEYYVWRYIDPLGYIPSWNIGGRHFTVAKNKRMWATYLKATGGFREVFAAYSDDMGSNWTIEQVSSAGNTQAGPTILLDSQDRPWVIWRGMGGGANPAVNRLKWSMRDPVAGWSATAFILDDATAMDDPSSAIDKNDRIHVCAASGCSPLYYWDYPAGGPWSARTLIMDDSSKCGTENSLVVDNDCRVHVVGRKGFSTGTRMYYRSKADGVTWAASPADVQVTFNRSMNPSLAVDIFGNIYLCYEKINSEFVDSEAVWFRKKAYGGAWGAETEVQHIYSDGTSRSQSGCQMQTDRTGKLTVAWVGVWWGVYPNIASLVYAYSVDGGATWWYPIVGTNQSTIGVNFTTGSAGANDPKWTRPKSGFGNVFGIGASTGVAYGPLDGVWGAGQIDTVSRKLIAAGVL